MEQLEIRWLPVAAVGVPQCQYSQMFFHKSAVDFPVGISCGSEMSVGRRVINMTMTSIPRIAGVSRVSVAAGMPSDPTADFFPKISGPCLMSPARIGPYVDLGMQQEAWAPRMTESWHKGTSRAGIRHFLQIRMLIEASTQI